MTLIDLAGVTRRRYGGAGFSLSSFPAEVQTELAKDARVQFDCDLCIKDKEAMQALVRRVSSLLHANFSVRVCRVPPQHVGFGSKTALLLAICAACNDLVGHPLSREQLQLTSGRGGASGAGINLFFQGGFLVDLGHPEAPGAEFVPSGAQCPGSVPPVSVSFPFPAEWLVHLFRPFGNRYAGGQESDFFARNTPIPDLEVLHVLGAVYHGVIPAMQAHDLGLLKDALIEIHAQGFKRREVMGQPRCVAEVLDALKPHKQVGVGMSSMGPLVYAVTGSESTSVAAFGQAWEKTGAGEYLGACTGRNAGYEVLGASHD